MTPEILNQWNKTGVRRDVNSRGVRTAVWEFGDAHKPFIIMVHGITGNHFGLLPLAYELRTHFRIYIVDLPNHGESDFSRQAERDINFLRDWFDGAVDEICRRENAQPERIVAHSYGCLVVSAKMLEQQNVVLISPPMAVGRWYKLGVKIGTKLSHSFAFLYNLRIFSMPKACSISKVRSRETMRLMRWNSVVGSPKWSQVPAQTRMFHIALSPIVMSVGDISPHSIIAGRYDLVVPLEELEANFADISQITVLEAGHLPPLECPKLLAQDIIDLYKKLQHNNP